METRGLIPERSSGASPRRRVALAAALAALVACGGGASSGAIHDGTSQPCLGDACTPPPPPPPPPPAACAAVRAPWPTGRDPAYRSPLADENARPGEAGWFDGTRAPLDASGLRRLLELYTSRTSVKAGETVEVKVHSSEARSARWVLYRVGWYGGARARRVAEGNVPVGPQPVCPLVAETGLVRCGWTTTFAIPFGADLVSGYYAVKVVRRDAAGTKDELVAFAPLVLVDDRPADLLMQAGTNTWEAYNVYGGESLYADDSGLVPGRKAVQVSFDRPFDHAGLPSRYVRYEAPFAQWLERIGYDVSYTTTNDVALGGCTHLVRAGMVFEVGHDEYVAGGARDALEHARDAGVPLAFFSANPLYWKVRLESFDGARNPRIVTVYKADPSLDPDPADQTGRFRDALVNRPENALVGVMYESWQVLSFPLVVADATSWLFQGTGLSNGDVLRFLVGHEYDRRLPQFASLQPAGLSVLLRSPVLDAEGTPGFGEAVAYRAPSGALVFAAGTIQWAYGLDDGPNQTHGAADPRVERMTANVFREALGIEMPRPPQIAPRPLPASSGPGTAVVSTVATGFEAPAGLTALPDGTLAIAEPRLHQVYVFDPRTGLVVLAGKRGTIGTVDGPSVSLSIAKFRAPTAALALPDGRIALSDTGNHVVRIVDRSAGTVNLLAGAMAQMGFADGPAQAARFSFPMGLAVDAAGSVLVADSANGRIRKIAPDGTTSTLAGGGTLDPAPGDAPVPASQLLLLYPTAVAVAPDGTVVALSSTKVFAIAGGHARALAGGAEDDFADGAPATARLGAYGGAAIVGGKLYFPDAPSYRLRSVDLATGRVETVAGGWRSATVDGAGAAAAFALPVGVAASASGGLYVSDAASGTIRAVVP